MHPEESARAPYVSTAFGPAGPVVAVSDWIKAVPGQIACWVPRPVHLARHHGWGFSGTRPAARRFFRVDAELIALAMLWELVRVGKIPVGLPGQRSAQLSPRKRPWNPSWGG